MTNMDTLIMSAEMYGVRIMCANEDVKAKVIKRASEWGVRINEPIVMQKPEKLYGVAGEFYIDEFAE